MTPDHHAERDDYTLRLSGSVRLEYDFDIPTPWLGSLQWIAFASSAVVDSPVR
jgi:hypothetical protein